MGAKPSAAQPTLTELIDTARGATRELREAIKDARLATRELDTARQQLTAMVEREADRQVDATVKAMVEEAAKAITRAQRDAERHAAKLVHDKVDLLMRTYLEGEERHAVSIPDVMAARQTLRKWNQQDTSMDREHP